MLRTISILLLVSCLAEAALAARDNGQSAEDGTEISLSVGGQKVISASGVANFSEGTPGIIQVKVPDDGRRLVLSGLRPGSTTLLLIYQGGKQETLNISVYPRAPAVVRNELKQLVTAYSGIEVREVGGRVFLDGAVPAQQDLDRITRIIEGYGGQVASFVTVDPAKSKINIKLDLHFVQMRKNSSHSVGVNWPGNFGKNASGTSAGSFLYTFDFLSRASTLGQIVVADNLLPSLDILGSRGWAKVKNVVSVITSNGGTATYHTGGEANIKIATALGQSSLQKIPFGVQLTVQPRLDVQSGMVMVSIDAEQSQLQPLGNLDVPGRNLTSTKTNVQLKIGQSIMLSGFHESTDSLTGSGIPGLMSIPILGYLFRTESGDSTQTENVLFITPTVIEYSSADNTRRIEDALKRYEDFGGHIVY